MTLRYLSRYNGYMPRETGMLIAYVRKTWPLMDYVQLVPTKKPVATYTVLERDAFIRLATGDGDMNAWEDGDPRPSGRYNRLKHEKLPVRVRRKDFPWEIGYQALEEAEDYQVRPAHMQMATSQAMTELTARVWNSTNGLQSNTPFGSNVADANTLNGGRGKWSLGSDDPNDPHYNAILLTLQNAAQVINLYTNAQVKPGDLCVVLSPGAAIATAAAPEIANYCRESPYSREILEKGLDPQYSLWGLPATYKGFRFKVEDSPIVAENPKESGVEATGNRRRIVGDTQATILSRVGGLDGILGAPAFSTVQIYHKEGLTKVQAFDDPKHELVEGHVVTDTEVVFPASVASYRVLNIL